MKKHLLIYFLLLCYTATTAQNRKVGARVHLNLNAKAIPLNKVLPGGDEDVPLNSNLSRNVLAPQPVKRTFASVTETSIGVTDYDLQTNESIQNRLLKHSDGTISATWTFAPVGSATGFPQRGTGYNYFDGTAWGPTPTVRIDGNQRSGWPNVVVTASNKETIINHANTAPGMLMLSRQTKGTGAWTPNSTLFGNFVNDFWAKAIKGGTNGQTIHALWQGSGVSGVPYLGQNGPLLYSRSTDEGLTWPVLRSLIPAVDSTQYLGFGADAYAIDTKGDTVVVVIGNFTTDLVLLKSFDNGSTWTSQIIQPFFQPLYDADVDSFPDLNGNGSSFDDLQEGASGDACVLIDNLGKTHVWWSNLLMRDSSAASPVFFFPNSLDGLMYWNDGFATGQAPDTIAFAEDGLNANGILDIPQTGLGGANGMGGYRGSITQMPSAGVDANNNLYVSYQSFCEDCDTSAFNTGHKHIYLKGSTNQGLTWGPPVDIDQSPDLLNQEDVFACVAKAVDANCIHVIYQRDGAPGHKISTNVTEAGWNSGPSEIIYACVPPTDVIIVSSKSLAKANAASNLLQNNPNPSVGSTNINYKIATNQSKVTFEVTDVLGNVVYAEDKGTLNAGSYNLVLNTEAFSAGLYFYTLTVNNQKETKKMLVK
jgi:hypothetical protein